MKIDDQTLSAFLDSELSANEMEAIRNAIAEDEQLAFRLAELSEVDMLVKQHAAHIACKQEGIWQLHASSEQRAISSQSYRLASKTPALDSYIDEHIQGQSLDRNAEQQALTNHWQ